MKSDLKSFESSPMFPCHLAQFYCCAGRPQIRVMSVSQINFECVNGLYRTVRNNRESFQVLF